MNDSFGIEQNWLYASERLMAHYSISAALDAER